MKIRDIPQFTKDPNYAIDVPWSSLEIQLGRYAKSYQLELEPDFQRGHVWSESKQIAFIEFCLRGGMSAQNIYFNCPGWMGRKTGVLQLVDGLQRVTAVLRFLKDEIPAFGLRLSEYEDGLVWNPSLRFHVNDLKTRAEVLTWYLEMNSGGVVHLDEELDRVRGLLKAEAGR